MHRSVYIWILWLIFATNALSVAAPVRLADKVGSQAPILDLTSPPSRPDTHDGLFTEPAAVPPALSARQGKQSLVLAHAVSLVPHVRGRMRPPRPVLVPAFSPWRFFSPRKLAPPPAEDDPFLS